MVDSSEASCSGVSVSTDDLPAVAETLELVEPTVPELVDPVALDAFADPVPRVVVADVEPAPLVEPERLLEEPACDSRTSASAVSAVESDVWSVASWVSAALAARRASAHTELDDQ